MFILIAAGALAAAAPGPEADMAAGRGKKQYVPSLPVDREATCAALLKQDPAKAEAEAADWRKAKGGVPAFQCLALALSAQEKWGSAADAFEQGARQAELQDQKIAAVLWMQGGNAALAGDEPVRARADLDRALALPNLSDQMKGEVHIDRARAGVAANDPAGAHVDLVAAVKLVPQDPLGWLLTANLARRQQDIPGAVVAIREAAKLAPGDAAVAYEGGNIAAASGHMDDAKAAWTRAAQLDPHSDAGQAAALALKGGDGADKP